jgi:hypothetical protein
MKIRKVIFACLVAVCIAVFFTKHVFAASYYDTAPSTNPGTYGLDASCFVRFPPLKNTLPGTDGYNKYVYPIELKFECMVDRDGSPVVALVVPAGGKGATCIVSVSSPTSSGMLGAGCNSAKAGMLTNVVTPNPSNYGLDSSKCKGIAVPQSVIDRAGAPFECKKPDGTSVNCYVAGGQTAAQSTCKDFAKTTATTPGSSGSGSGSSVGAAGSDTGGGNVGSSTPPAELPSGNECASILAMFCEDADRGGQGIFDLLNLIVNILTVGVGIAATVGIVISAIQYITAREKEDQAKKARTRIFEIVLGMIIWAVMWIVLNFLMPGGVSN